MLRIILLLNHIQEKVINILTEQKKLMIKIMKNIKSCLIRHISLSNAIPMWIKYSKSKPKQSWMVIHLLKDALFALDRYDELEYILKEIMDQDENNSEVIATLADMYAHKGDLDNALEIVNSSFQKNSNSLIIKLIKLKLLSLNGEFNVSKGLDDIIHFLVTDEGYHKYKNTPPDEDIVWIYENSDENKD